MCAAGLHSVRRDRVRPAGFVFEGDHDLLPYLCSDDGTWGRKDKYISWTLIKTNKQAKLKCICTQNSQVLLVILLHGEGVVGVFSIRHLFVAGADPVFSSPQKCVARAGRATAIKTRHQTARARL